MEIAETLRLQPSDEVIRPEVPGNTDLAPALRCNPLTCFAAGRITLFIGSESVQKLHAHTSISLAATVARGEPLFCKSWEYRFEQGTTW